MPLSQQAAPRSAPMPCAKPVVVSVLFAFLLLVGSGSVAAQHATGWGAPSEGAQSPWHVAPDVPPADNGYSRPADPPDNPGGVPDWAAPHPGTIPQYGDMQWERARQPNSEIGMHGPGLPTSPNKLPVGGLEWLLAAGAGYAAHRLRKEDEGTDTENAPQP